MTQTSRRGARARAQLRRLAQLLVIGLGWVGFVWMWLLVAARPWESQRLMWLIVGSLLIVPLLTGAWVMHNRSIHRRKGERQAVAVADTSYAHDWHGRVVHADWAALQRSRVVFVSIEAEHKHYLGSRIADDAAAASAARRQAAVAADPSRTRHATVAQDAPRA
jgi:hypothetical protein